MKRIALKKTLLVSWLAGIIVPIVLFTIHSYALKNSELRGVFLTLYIMLWPSSLGLSDSSSIGLIHSIAINSLYYLILGYLLWFGINKSRAVLYVLISAFVLFWGGVIIAFY